MCDAKRSEVSRGSYQESYRVGAGKGDAEEVTILSAYCKRMSTMSAHWHPRAQVGEIFQKIGFYARTKATTFTVVTAS